jgi:ribosome biogenesis GTPase A
VWKSVDEFLGQVARKRGYLQQGGIANFDQAARQVIRDFVNGKLVYHTNPPDFDDNVGDSDDGAMEDQEMS